MPLTKSVGNMYPWVTHMHTHIGGKCPHACSYCYTRKSRYGIIPRYQGELRLIDKELQVNYGSGKTIFIEHMNDMFAEAVPQEFVNEILAHCRLFSDNTYVFQSKNPYRILDNLDFMPPKIIIGTTIETNYLLASISKAPSPLNRGVSMGILKTKYSALKTFVTIEPIMRFNLQSLVNILGDYPPSPRIHSKGLLGTIISCLLNHKKYSNRTKQSFNILQCHFLYWRFAYGHIAGVTIHLRRNLVG